MHVLKIIQQLFIFQLYKCQDQLGIKKADHLKMRINSAEKQNPHATLHGILEQAWLMAMFTQIRRIQMILLSGE